MKIFEYFFYALAIFIFVAYLIFYITNFKTLEIGVLIVTGLTTFAGLFATILHMVQRIKRIKKNKDRKRI